MIRRLAVALLALAGCKQTPVGAAATGPGATATPAPSIVSSPAFTLPAGSASPRAGDRALVFDYARPAERHVPAAPKADDAIRARLLGAAAAQAEPDDRACVAKEATVVDGAAGAFSAPGATESVYFVDGSTCGPRASASARRWLVLIHGAKTTVVAAPESSVDALVDLDGDGVSALLVSDGFTGQGETVTQARVVDLRAGAPHVREDLGEVHHDTCGATQNRKSTSKSIEIERAGGRGHLLVSAMREQGC